MPPRVARFFPKENVVRPLAAAMELADPAARFPAPPPWRDFASYRREVAALDRPPDDAETTAENKLRGGGLVIDDEVADAVNAALILRRPLLVTGKPGTGKSSLAYAIAYRLALGRVLVWPITSRSTLKQGLYEYDAVARLENASRRFYEEQEKKKEGGAKPAETVEKADGKAAADGEPHEGIGKYIRLGPVGTALLPTALPRVLLIDEIDKSDVDLPNDLLHAFEEGRFRIDELARLPEEVKEVPVFPNDSNKPVPVGREWVACREFPVVVLTSNAEREFPPAFNRRCVRLTINEPTKVDLAEIVRSRLFRDAEPATWLTNPDNEKQVRNLVDIFYKLRKGVAVPQEKREQAVDQLLNAVHLMLHGFLEVATNEPGDRSRGWELRELVLRSLTDTGAKEEK